MTPKIAVWVWLVVALATGSTHRSVAQTLAGVASCEATPPVSMLEVVGPMAGTHPAWLVDGSASWSASTTPIKTLWVFAQSDHGFEVTGRRQGGSETARFRTGNGQIKDTLTVVDLRRETVRPGGAGAEVLQRYAFIPSHVYYPVAGCWEFTLVSAGETHRIVKNLEERR